MLGSEVFLYFDEDGESCSVRLKPSNQTRPNEKMTFYFNPDKIHIFDINTEENLFKPKKHITKTKFLLK